MGAFKNLVGERYGRLTVAKFGGRRNRRSYWVCVCDCGAEVEIRADSIRSGSTTSCGCAQKQAVSEANSKHGMCESPEYIAWTQARYRCGKKDHPNYRNYGGRGISVCDRWQDSFDAFYADMGPRPSDKHSLERVDNDKGYSPENCKWATSKEQGNNKRSCRIIEHEGVSLNVTQWAQAVGMCRNTLTGRLNRGKSVDQALFAKVGRRV